MTDCSPHEHRDKDPSGERSPANAVGKQGEDRNPTHNDQGSGRDGNAIVMQYTEHGAQAEGSQCRQQQSFRHPSNPGRGARPCEHV